jgi:uncharacterized protein
VATFRFEIGADGSSSGEIFSAKDPSCHATLVLAHGAGAPRTHPFMRGIAKAIAHAGIDVVTFNFVYAEAGRRMPDRPEQLEACFWSAIAAVRARRGLPTERLFVGGKSMGGRVAARIAKPPIAGLVVLGYPLHPPGKPAVVREELFGVTVPRLVVQGTRDAFGSAEDLAPRLRKGELVAIEDGDHSFTLPKRCGPGAQGKVFQSVAGAVAAFTQRVAVPRTRGRRPML